MAEDLGDLARRALDTDGFGAHLVAQNLVKMAPFVQSASNGGLEAGSCDIDVKYHFQIIGQRAHASTQQELRS